MAVKPVKTVTTSDAKKGAEKKSKGGKEVHKEEEVFGFIMNQPQAYPIPKGIEEDQILKIYIPWTAFEDVAVVSLIIEAIIKGKYYVYVFNTNNIS